MISGFLKGVEKLAATQSVRDDDTTDRLHHIVSVLIFIGFASAATLKQYVGDPIHCWTPAEFTGSHGDYAENYCFISHMYRVPWEDALPWDVDERYKYDISFYRWVPVIFLFMALLFKFPNVLWEQLKTYSGMNVKRIVSMAEETVLVGEEDRQEKIKHIGYFMDRWLRNYRMYKNDRLTRARQKMSGVFCFVLGKRTGTYLTGLYFFIKLLYCLNVVGQFFLLSRFLDIDFFNYGWNIVAHFNNHGEFRDLENFPRVVFCDFEIRQLQNIQRFTLQCALSINLFTEKMFAITWFWLIIIAVASLVNLIKWVVFIFFRSSREKFIEKYLGLLELKRGTGDRTLFKQFVTDYLRDDGVFVLRSVSYNTNPILTLDLVRELWLRFKDLHKPAEDDEVEPTTRR